MKSQNEWPASGVEMRALASLVPYARNSRTHSAEQVEQIAASMREWGWTNPVLIDEAGTILAGHGRVLAAQQLGLGEVPVMVARGWSAAQKQAYVIADNKLALNAGWDMSLLSAEIGDLKGAGFDVGLVGFSLDELSAMAPGASGGAPGGGSGEGKASGSLAERFGVPPFSVLRAAEGWWQARKQAWLAMGIQSEVGRGENLLKFSNTINQPDPAKRTKNGKRKAATFGQDLMRGEHVVGGNG